MTCSVVIITLNEEKDIEACIKSVVDISDDIIVIDANSHDKTADLAKALGAKVYSYAWSGYGAARNYGANEAQHDWILSIDADEYLSQEAKEFISKLKLQKDSKNTTCYAIKRINHIGQMEMKWGHLRPEWKTKLYNKKHYQWGDQSVHETLAPKIEQGEKIKGLLYHYQADDINELRSKIQSYASLNPTHHHTVIRHAKAMFHLVKNYVIMGGFLHGELGWKIAKIYYQYTLQKYQISQ